ncbi:MAG TPA: PDZ domain-containing protein [Spirochaetia bacterium]|nr:PDZ domain-containing protein [Spirochaetia bacterium]
MSGAQKTRVGRVVVGFSLLVLLGCATSHTPTRNAPDLKLSFVIDTHYDQDMIVAMFRHDDPAGLESRAASMGIDTQMARRIRDAVSSEAGSLAARIVEDRFKRNGAAIQASKADCEAEWKDLLPLFSRVVVETTESPWVHSEYLCVVSAIFPGLSNWSGSKVSVRYDYSSEYRRGILAHEIVLSDVFQLLRKRFASSEISDWQVWAISEITPDFVLDDPRLRPFWPDFPHEWTHSGYAQLAGLETRLKDAFDHRTSYVDYEEKAAQILKGFQPFNPASRVHYGWLGVFVANPEEKDSYLELSKEAGFTGTGSLVLGLYEGSPADRAGLRAGDVIIALGSTPIDNSGQLMQIARSLAPGTEVSMTVTRRGEQKILSVTLGSPEAKGAGAQRMSLWPGFTVKDVAVELNGKVGSPGDAHGVVVASIGSDASRAVAAGLRLGDRITAVNGITVARLKDFYMALDANGGKEATLAINRDGEEMTLRLEERTR